MDGTRISDTMAESKTPTQSRSFSDPTQSTALAPSPTFRERIAAASNNELGQADVASAIDSITTTTAAPTTPKAASRRSDFLARGLSLQMPETAFAVPSPSRFPSSQLPPAPLSPQLDRNNIYMQQSPATTLPRHSRGLDFSRASTNLHHSTLAECSPDASPLIIQRGMMIPSRKGSSGTMMLDSPHLQTSGFLPWGTLATERSAVSSSVGSVNMLASESESNDSDDDASMGGDDNEDPIFTTPQVRKLQNPNAATPFAVAPTTPGAGGSWGTGNHFSPAQVSLVKTIRRSRLQKNGKRSRKSSSSASGSGYSSMASPRNTSPPPLRSIESATHNGYFNWPTAARSRRESLALGTDGLHLSSGNDSGDEASASNTPSTPGVVKRAVTRRGNLLPKTKGFARIRAALMEEAAPVDSEVRREAETMQQVRERDGGLSGLDLTPSERPKTATEPSSPSLLPTVSKTEVDDTSEDNPKGLGMSFAAHANRNSGGLDYWNRYDPSFRTPPPPNFARHSSASTLSDTNMDTEIFPNWRPRPRAQSSVSDAASETTQSTVQPSTGAMNDDMHLNRFKRRREDDFDISTIKRRAVSPGMSANNSPVLTQSPSLKDTNGSSWGQPPDRNHKSSQSTTNTPSDPAHNNAGPASSHHSSRHGSGGSSMSLASGGGTLAPSLSGGSSGGGGGGASTPATAAGGRKLGLQGMVDTNDGLMKMTIE